MTPIVLYGTRLSPFVEKVARALELKKLRFDLVVPRSPLDFRRSNPRTGKIPALDLDGERLYDSTFILRALEARFPDPPLLAEDPRVAAAQRQLEDWSDESLYWYLMALRWSEANRRAAVEQISAEAAPAWRPLMRLLAPRRLGGTTRAQGLGRLPHATLVRELGILLDDLVLLLGERPFFYASRPNVADLALYGQFRMALSGPTPEAAALLCDRAALVDHTKRVEEATKV